MRAFEVTVDHFRGTVIPANLLKSGIRCGGLLTSIHYATGLQRYNAASVCMELVGHRPNNDQASDRFTV